MMNVILTKPCELAIEKLVLVWPTFHDCPVAPRSACAASPTRALPFEELPPGSLTN